jgi:Uma2 family endonuclease
MGLAKEIKRYTPAEYYDLERKAEYKSDYYDGEIFAMAGGTKRHSLICTNIAGELRQRLKGKPCVPYESNLRLKVKETGLRTYPDVSVYCGEPEPDPEDVEKETMTNPTVLFEVLSPTTESYDRTVKRPHYRRVEALQMLVLVSQDKPYAEVYQREADGDWTFREAEGLNASLALTPLGVELPMAEIYYNVDFSKSE